MADLLTLFHTFVRVVEAGSFSAVAVEQNTSQPTVSRQIANLEDHLGCLLFQRTTRSLTLTEDGRGFYAHAQRAVETFAEAQSSVGRRKGKPSGALRLSSPAALANLHIIPRMPRFMRRYPDVLIDLVITDGVADIVEEGIDLAIQVGDLNDNTLIARRIGTARRVIVATPDYLERRGEPQIPADLLNHDCVVHSRLSDWENWSMRGADGMLTMRVSGRFKVNSTDGVRAGVLEGLGIGMVPIWHYSNQEIETGQLKIVLTAYEPEPKPVNAVYSSRRFLSPKVRAMIDFLTHEFELDPRLSIHDAV